MSLVSKEAANKLKKEAIGEINPRGLKLAGSLFHQFNMLHSKSYFEDKEIETMLLKQKKLEIEQMDKVNEIPYGVVKFSPSGASKCPRELFFKALREEKDEQLMYPFQKRWTRNASAVHEAVQRDFLYMEKYLQEPAFTIARTDSGLPSWENNIKAWKLIKHKGSEFIVLGMMDGIMNYNPEGIKIGFEFKTKSTTIAQVGTFKMKDASDSHKTQCTAYSILFGLDEFIIMYESLAKDNWMEGSNAKTDIRTFYHRVTKEDRNTLLDKFAKVSNMVKTEQLPDGDTQKCIFCEYKTVCETMSDVA